MVTSSVPYKYYSTAPASIKQKKQRALSWALRRVTGSRVFLAVEASEDITKALKMYELTRSQLEIVLRRELKNI